MATLLSGLLIAIIRIVLELSGDYLTEGSVLHTIGEINFLSFAAWLFFFSVLIAVGVSLATAKQPESQLEGLTFGTTTAEQRAFTRSSYTIVDVVASLIVVAIVVYIMISFNG